MMKVITAGTFDLFHQGHVNLLRRCKDFGQVTVALNTDEFIEMYKGKPPIIDYVGRWSVLMACKYVDKVVPNSQGRDEPSMLPVLQDVKPDLIVIGSDWMTRDYLGQVGLRPEWLERSGIGLVYVPYTQGVSSTVIKQRMATGIQGV